jgi:small-conductance mechanosensitive channel
MKVLIGLFNFIVFISGAAVFIVGVVGTVRKDWQAEILNGFRKVTELAPKGEEVQFNLAQNVNTILIVAIVVGSIVMLMGFLGCCGAFCESQCLLNAFAGIMITMIIIELVLGSLAIAYKDQMREKFTDPSIDLVFKYALNTTEACESAKTIQREFKCCGPNGGPVSPVGDCANLNDCPGTVGTSCKTAFGEFVQRSLTIAGIVVLVFMALEFMAVIFACCLICAIRNGDSYSTIRHHGY